MFFPISPSPPRGINANFGSLAKHAPPNLFFKKHDQAKYTGEKKQEKAGKIFRFSVLNHSVLN
jgi:hypothetical protein